jgi:SAM-dependent methyltransferase
MNLKGSAKKTKYEMRKQWDEIANRNPFFGIDAITEFEQTNIDTSLFWQRGREAVDGFLENLQLGDTSKWTMVEIGCGLGRMTHRFAQKFNKVYAVDVSLAMLEKARSIWKEFSNIEFILGSGADLKPIKTNTTDFVFSFIVLQHVLEEAVVLNYIREAARVLHPAGIAFLQFRTFTPAVPQKLSLLSHIKRVIPRKIKLFLKGIIQPPPLKPLILKAEPKNLDEEFGQNFPVWHGCRVSTTAVEKTANQVGLKIIRVEGINSPQYTYYTFQKIQKS